MCPPDPVIMFTFPQQFRMKTPAEFDRCYARKRSAADGVLIVYACENGLPHPRLGCSVSKKVGGAVVRNRFKRLLREAFRLARHDLPTGLDVVVIPRTVQGKRKKGTPVVPTPAPSLAAVKESLVRLTRQAARRLGETGPTTSPRPRPGPPPPAPHPPEKSP